MRLKNVLITLAVVGLAGYGGLKLHVFYNAKENFQQILYCAGMPRLPDNVPKSDYFDYDRISASIFGPIGIKGLKIRIPGLDEEISFGEITLTVDYDGDIKNCPTPRHINFAVKEMRVDVTLLEKIEKQQEEYRRKGLVEAEQVPAVIRRLGYSELYQRTDDFRALGYNSLVVDFTFDMKVNKSSDEATVGYQVAMRDLGDLRTKMTISGVAKNINSAVLGAKIKEASIEFDDDSYIERLFKVFAEQHNTDVDTYRASLLEGMQGEFDARELKLNPDTVSNLKKFLAEPGKLIVTMYPFNPVGIESIKHYKPGDVPMLLNLQIYAEK